MVAWHDTPWMWLSMVAFWSLFVAFAYYAFVGLTRRATAHSRLKPAEILEQRFASGDISAEEYRTSRETLEATRVQGSGR